MTDPQTVEEYNARAIANLHYEQRTGIHGITAHLPCPFCAAPDFMVFQIYDPDPAFEAGGTCAECGRSSRAIVKRSPDSVTFEVVQTGGDDPPACMPKMRRVE